MSRAVKGDDPLRGDETLRGDDPFALFGLPRSFEIDEPSLEREYLRLQRRYHPDLFVNADGETRTKAQLNACTLNDAFEKLKDPIKRGVCLLRLADHPSAALEEGTIADAELLEEALELRQALAETQNAERLAAISANHRAKSERCLAELSKAFAAADLPAADKQTVKLRYLNKLGEEIRRQRAKQAAE